MIHPAPIRTPSSPRRRSGLIHPRARYNSPPTGLGDGYQTGALITQTAGAIATGVITTSTTAATATAAAGAGATLAASTAAIAIPLIGAAVLAVTLVLASIARKNAQKTAATSIVDQVEPQLRINRDAYLAGPRTKESQAQALANFQAGWNLVLENCGPDRNLGSAGERCIAERLPGGQWDWSAYYRDPIANDIPRDSASSNPFSSAAAELLPDLTPEQLANVPTYAALAALAIGLAML